MQTPHIMIILILLLLCQLAINTICLSITRKSCASGKEGEKCGKVEIYGLANNFISQSNIDKQAITKNVVSFCNNFSDGYIFVLEPKKNKIPKRVKAFEISKPIMYYIIYLSMEVMNVLSCRPKCTYSIYALLVF